MVSSSRFNRVSFQPLLAGALLWTVGCAGLTPPPSTAPGATPAIPAVVAAVPVAPTPSVFDLSDIWYSERAPAARLSSLNGALLVVGFVDDACGTACTTTLKAMRAIERETDQPVHFLLVSSAGDLGTPATLAAFSKAKRLSAARYTVVSSNASGIANLVAALNRGEDALTAADMESRSALSVLDFNGMSVRQRSSGVIDALLESLALLQNMR